MPADLRNIVDQKKMIRRSLNISMMQKPAPKQLVSIEEQATRGARGDSSLMNVAKSLDFVSE